MIDRKKNHFPVPSSTLAVLKTARILQANRQHPKRHCQRRLKAKNASPSENFITLSPDHNPPSQLSCPSWIQAQSTPPKRHINRPAQLAHLPGGRSIDFCSRTRIRRIDRQRHGVTDRLRICESSPCGRATRHTPWASSCSFCSQVDSVCFLSPPQHDGMMDCPPHQKGQPAQQGPARLQFPLAREACACGIAQGTTATFI